MPMPKPKPKQRLAVPLAALAILMPVLAACGGSGGSSEGADGSAAGGPGGGGGASSAEHAQYLKFAQCMRKNGIREWPDPIDGNKFRLPRGKIDPNSPQFKEAARKCESLEPPSWKSGSRPDPADQAQMLKYAQCIRQNGVPEFPDPQGGALNLGDVDIESPRFKAADEKCKSLRPRGAGG